MKNSPSWRKTPLGTLKGILDGAGTLRGTLGAAKALKRISSGKSTSTKKKFKSGATRTKTQRRRKIGRAGVIRSGEGRKKYKKTGLHNILS